MDYCIKSSECSLFLAGFRRNIKINCTKCRSEAEKQLPSPAPPVFSARNHLVNTRRGPGAIGAQALIFRVDN